MIIVHSKNYQAASEKVLVLPRVLHQINIAILALELISLESKTKLISSIHSQMICDNSKRLATLPSGQLRRHLGPLKIKLQSHLRTKHTSMYPHESACMKIALSKHHLSIFVLGVAAVQQTFSEHEQSNFLRKANYRALLKFVQSRSTGSQLEDFNSSSQHLAIFGLRYRPVHQLKTTALR